MTKRESNKTIFLNATSLLTAVSFIALIIVTTIKTENPMLIGIAVVFLATAVAMAVHHADVIAHKASIALTIPVISVYSLITNRPVAMGLDAKETAFTIITFIVGGLTLSTGRVSALKGLVHLMLLLAYLVLSFVP